MAEGQLNAKAIRQAHAAIEQIQTKQYQYAGMLHRIFYKSKAQHRSAKWFQSVGGMRKCYTRLLDMSSVRSQISDSLPDRGVNAKDRSRRDGSESRDLGSINTLQRSIGQVWSSLWADSRMQDGSLVKYDRPPSKNADPLLCLATAYELLIVCLQLEELASRSKVAFNLLQTQMRTPPALTFAPIVVTLLSLCAQIYSACQEALWSDGGKAIGLARLYGVFRSVGAAEAKGNTLVLDGTSRAHKLAVQKTLNVIQGSSNRRLEKLPLKVIKASPRMISSGENQIHDMELDTTISLNVVSSAAYGDDEDLGVAV